MLLDELFSKEEIVTAKLKGIETRHYLRQPTPKEDLDFRRKCANVKVKNREIQTSDQALQAPIDLYDAICQRVIVENGDGPQEVPEFKNKIPPDLKLAVISAYQRRIEIDESETLGN